MQYIKYTVMVIILIVTSGCYQHSSNQAFDAKINKLLEEKSYFKIRKLLTANEDMLSNDRLLYYTAFVEKAFGDSKKSNESIALLLDKYKENLPDAVVVKLLDLKATNYLNAYQYKWAAEIYGTLIKHHAQSISSIDLENYKNVKNLFSTVANVKPQIMHLHNAIPLASHRNKFNHLMTPVRVNNVMENFIFDTGANLSTISESQAKKMKLTIFEQKINVGSATNIAVQSKMAVADSLYLGNILFENVLFLVMPDQQLFFSEINYKIYGIIGFPIIQQLEEIHLHKDGTMLIPKKAVDKNIRNLAVEGLNPIVEAVSGKDTLLFTVDTGAKNSELSFQYFKNHKADEKTWGKLNTAKRGSAGGVTHTKEYTLKNFSINIGTKKCTLPNIAIATQEYEFNKYFDGNLGQDVFSKFNTVVLNFKYGYVDFE